MSESEAILVLAVLALLPNFLGEAFGEQGFCAGWEVREVLNFVCGLQPGADHCAVGISISDLNKKCERELKD